ncbi:MAG: proton-conducting transporter membrane subunit [Bacteroidota bacterium]
MIALPVLIPLFTAILLVFSNQARYQKIIGVSGAFAIFATSLFIISNVGGKQIEVLQSSNWEAPFGISLVVDTFSALMLVITGFVSFALAVYSLFYIDEKLITHRYFLFFHTLLMGVNGAFITGDVFNLYVWFEVMLMSSFVLITLGSKPLQLKGGIKYLTMNLVASLFFLAGIGILYGKTGTLNMAHLAVILQNDEQAILMNTSTMLFFMAFGIKAAVFPFFFWLPSSYHTPPVAVTAFFAALLTKVGVYAMIRVFTLFFIQDPQFWHTLLLAVAGLTMVVGGMAAASHYEIRRILSFHIISQIGYMIFGLGVFTPLALAGAIYFMIHNMLAKTNTFLVAGHINRLKGTYKLKSIGGLYKSYPLLGILFIIPAFALAGVPPLPGFFGKFFLIKAGFEAEKWFISGVAIFTGVLTVFSMIKIWNEAFFKKGLEEVPEQGLRERLPLRELLPSMMLGAGTILLGIGAGVFFDYFIEAGNQLMNSDQYIQVVLKNFEYVAN